jgi:CDP-paratose 2-epimerase
MTVVGVDNDMRAYFFGPEGSTDWRRLTLQARKGYDHRALDIRDREGILALFKDLGPEIALVVHTAAQPSHDWAAKEPFTDFDVNAGATLNLLEATRLHSPDAVFIYTSTNKVYGDTPNRLPLIEKASRWECDPAHPYAEHGIDESMSIDATLHSLFGASKVAGDVMVQEYGKYFGMKTGVFRGGCLTGPNHSGAPLHGFLAYLAKCAVTGTPYTVLGYKGKQVRDNIHARDLITALWAFAQAPRPGEVYNIGGSRHSCCSMMEAIALCEELTGRPMTWSYQEENRVGDHIWWISDVRKFQSHYPDWAYHYDIRAILTEIVEGVTERAAG